MILRYLITLINNLTHSDQRARLPGGGHNCQGGGGGGAPISGRKIRKLSLCDSTVTTICWLKESADFHIHVLL